MRLLNLRRCGLASVPAPSRHRRAGFSLVELLIVVAIMVVMYAMLGTSASQNYQSRQKKVCQQNLQQIFVALKIYAEDFQGNFPVVKSARTAEEPLNLLVPKYTALTQIFICPGSNDKELPEAEPFLKRKISYAYYMGLAANAVATVQIMSDAQVNTRSKLASDLLFSADGKAPGNNHNKYGGNILFADGHAEYSPIRAGLPLPVIAPVVLLNPKP